jgi:hypothetical protein
MDYVLAEPYKHLRAQALQLNAAEVGSADSTFGVLMETGYPEAVVSLLALADGVLQFAGLFGPLTLRCPALLRTSPDSCPGVRRRAAHPALARRRRVKGVTSRRRWARHAWPHVGTLRLRGSHFLRVRCHFPVAMVTIVNILERTADAPEREFGENRQVLSPLFYAAQELITEIRNSDGIG